MDLTLVHKIIVISISVIGPCLAFWVYFVNKKSRINQLFFLLTISIIVWVGLNYMANLTEQEEQALLYKRIQLGVVALFFVLSYFFVAYFPEEDRYYPFMGKIILLWGTVFFFISIFTDLIIKNIEIQEWGGEIIKGKLIDFFYVSMIFLTIFIIGKLFKKYLKLSENKKLKTQYFLIGGTIFALLNLIFNIFPVIFLKTFKYSTIGDYSTIFLLIFIAYGILQKNLFEIKTVLTDMLVVVMGLVLLFLPFFVETTFPMKILMFFVFFLFCFVGYLLIRYTHRETKQKEILEKQVQEKTEELQKKIEDLHKFHRLTVGRELKMVELKKEIEELKEEKK